MYLPPLLKVMLCYSDYYVSTMFEAVKCSIKVRIHHGVPPLRVEACYWSSELAPTIVHEEVDLSMLVNCVLHQPFDLQHKLIIT